MIWVLDFIEWRERSIVSYSFKIILVALVPTIFVALLAHPWLENSSFGDDVAFSYVDAFGLVVVAPLAETGLLVATIVLLRKLGVKWRGGIVSISAMLWAGLHSISVPVWGLVVFWNFCVWTAVYLDWERRSRVKAFWITSFFHAFNNSLSVFAVLTYE